MHLLQGSVDPLATRLVRAGGASVNQFELPRMSRECVIVHTRLEYSPVICSDPYQERVSACRSSEKLAA
jgi:hypothetical protein